MRSAWLFGVMLAFLAGWMHPTALSAQEDVRIKQIAGNPKAYLDRMIRVEGTVTRLDQGAGGDACYYMLSDDFGDALWVRTTRGFPGVGGRFQVTGLLSPDPRSGQPLIQEDSRWGSNSTLLIIVVAALLVFVVLVALLLKGRKRPAAVHAPPPPVDDGHAPSPPAPAGGSLLEGGTVKLMMPAAGTMKMLQGRFELPGDTKVREVCLFATNDGSAEVMFERDGGQSLSGPDQYRKILLKSAGVSARQAKLIFERGGYRLVNYARINPTKVNGVDLGLEESVRLEDGAEIQMADVRVIYRAK